MSLTNNPYLLLIPSILGIWDDSMAYIITFTEIILVLLILLTYDSPCHKPGLILCE